MQYSILDTFGFLQLKANTHLANIVFSKRLMDRLTVQFILSLVQQTAVRLHDA